MLPPLATIDQLAARLPADVPLDDQARAEAALTDASALVRDEAGATWVDSTGALTAVPDIVVVIVLEVAFRALDRSFTYGENGEARANGGLYLKADEKQRLNAAVTGGTKPALWVLTTTRGEMSDVDYRPDSSAPLSDPIPWGYTGPTPWNAP